MSGHNLVHNAINAIFNKNCYIKKDALNTRSSTMKKILFVLATVVMTTGIAQADTLLINSAYEQPEAARPARGITMNQVKTEFGEPDAVTGPVGDPPITTWIYPEFSVYFEYDRVLHSVMKREQMEESTE